MSSSPQFSYAEAFGIDSLGAPILFAVLYTLCVGFFTFKSLLNPTFVLFVLTLFCAIRVAAFAIRAAMAGSASSGRSLGLYIADQVLFGAGFAGLLYSAYILVLDREQASIAELPQGPISRITRNRRLFHLVLAVGVALGIAGSTQGTSPDSPQSERDLGHTLRVVGAIIPAVLTLLQAYRTFLFSIAEHEAHGDSNTRLKATHGNWVLCIISILLLVREAYSVAAIARQSLQTKEALWYPLLALPEILAVFLYATPGLVPSRSQLNQRSRDGDLEMLKSDHTYHG
ncbi:hypothetical protein CCMSSC00406_0007418 [Pleurotus cornucopiae]|uniref:Uncharacterized protein n=1 Tax=Pleurotus cornucopiae TaxID=5321 RepID=A0ACB7J7D3_PLECO|nr:hypothetical protein CCMSSC00406_0007418 [Pleurotus cornucopiae]